MRLFELMTALLEYLNLRILAFREIAQPADFMIPKYQDNSWFSHILYVAIMLKINCHIPKCNNITVYTCWAVS